MFRMSCGPLSPWSEGQLEVALFTAKTVEQYRDAIVNSLSDIERLSQIVRALLLLSQAETGQVVLQKQPLDLVEIADGIVDQFQIPAEGADVTLRFISHVHALHGRVRSGADRADALESALECGEIYAGRAERSGW